MKIGFLTRSCGIFEMMGDAYKTKHLGYIIKNKISEFFIQILNQQWMKKCLFNKLVGVT